MIGNLFRKKHSQDIGAALLADVETRIAALRPPTPDFPGQDESEAMRLAQVREERLAAERAATRSPKQREALKARRKDPADVRSVQVNVKLSPREVERARALANARGKSLAEMIVMAIDLLETQAS